MSDPEMVGKKLAAVTSLIDKMANESGYGHFITEGTRQQWAARIVDCIDQVENPPTTSATVAGVDVTGETVGT
ncbi:MAG TPA: hypothetical protein VF748_14835 [Candidatus Acidoferrum sp.]